MLPKHNAQNSNEKNQQAKIAYWNQQLADLALLKIQPDYPHAKRVKHLENQIHFKMDSMSRAALKKIAAANNTTLSNVLLAGIYTLLYRYTAETDICIAIAGKTQSGLDQNTHQDTLIPIRTHLDKENFFNELIQVIETNIKTAFDNELPLNDILQLLKKETDTFSQNPLFNVICQINESKNALESHEPNKEFSPCENFKFYFNIQNESVQGFLIYNANLFKQETVQRLIDQLQILLIHAADDPTKKISQISFLTEKEKLHLNKFNQKVTPTPSNDFIHLIFSRIAKAHPKKTAIVFHDENNKFESITYEDLDKLTDSLAAYLKNIEIGPEKTIGVSVTRSINLIIAIIAIFKAGGVVVPMESNLDCSESRESILYHKITDALVDTVIVDNNTINLFSGYPGKLFRLNIEEERYLHLVKKLGLTYQPPKLNGNNLAYIIYTSGTTGEPKGVMIEHTGLTNMAYAIEDRNLQTNSKILCTAPHTFDCFFFEMLEWLNVHGEFHFINEKERLCPEVQEKIMRTFDINCATLLPDIIKNINPENLPSLYDVISMGATPHKEVLEQWHRLGKVIRNEYGPTEATICSTVNPFKPGKSYTNIGKPIRNCNMFILDPNGMECPLGVPGELYIGGIGLARGYVGKPELTALKFPTMIFNPIDRSFSLETFTPRVSDYCLQFETKTKENNLKRLVTTTKTTRKRIKSDTDQQPKKVRLYSTGDLARYELDVDNQLSIDFLGRKDRQIKIHGVRIEIDGIEAILRKQPSIKDVYLSPNETKDYLIAYVVPKNSNKITREELENYLKLTSIPVVAWPQVIIELEKLPINKNGKLNIKALPRPEQEASLPATLTPLENNLCRIWAEVLHCDQINLTKTFKQHGGDSLSLAILETKLNRTLPLNKKIGINILNKDITITQLETLLKPYLEPTHPLSSSLPPTSNLPLSFFSTTSSTPLSFHPMQNTLLNKSTKNNL